MDTRALKGMMIEYTSGLDNVGSGLGVDQQRGH